MRRIINSPALLAAALLSLAGGAQAGEDADAPDSSGWHYESGHGLHHAGSGLTLGGYVTAAYQRLRGQSDRLRISHTSLFLWWEPIYRFKLLAEVDRENLIADDQRSLLVFPVGTAPEDRTSLERLHVNWTFDDALSVRAGKFLTPVGRWNMQHADPLTWTTNRPRLTQSVYPNNLTGVMASGKLALGKKGEQVLDYALYASHGTEWAPDPRQDPFASARGVRLVWAATSDWQFGMSYARYEQRRSRGERRTLTGLDMRWAARGYELSAEWLSTVANRSGVLELPGIPSLGDEDDIGPGVRRVVFLGVPTRGAYVQGVVPMTARLFAVSRVEWLHDALAPPTLRQSTLGLVWRPNAATAVKLEHQWTRGRAVLAPAGWTASMSVLF